MAKDKDSNTGKGKQAASANPSKDARRVTIAGASEISAIRNSKHGAGRETPFGQVNEKHAVPDSLRKKLFGDVLRGQAGFTRAASVSHGRPIPLNMHNRPGTPTPLRFDSIDSIIPPVKPMSKPRERRQEHPPHRIDDVEAENEFDDDQDDEVAAESVDNEDDRDYEEDAGSKKKGKSKIAAKKTAPTRAIRKRKTAGAIGDSERERKLVEAIDQVKTMLGQVNPLVELENRKRKANFSELEKALKKLRKGIEQVTSTLQSDAEEEIARRAHQDKVWATLMASLDDKEKEDREEAGAMLKECQEEIENAKRRTSIYIQGWYDGPKLKKAVETIGRIGI